MRAKTKVIVEHLNVLVKVQKEIADQNSLERMNYAYLSVADFVLQNGREFIPHRLPLGVELGEQKMCYANAANLAIKNRDYAYVEGFALHIIPVAHAWCIDNKGRVVDPTWLYTETDAYFGVVIPNKILRRALIEQKTYGVLDDWKRNWPILKKKWEVTDEDFRQDLETLSE